MDNSLITLNQVFVLEKKLCQEKLATLESAEKISELKKEILKQAKAMWPLAMEKIVEKIIDVLDISVPEILVAAWNKYAVLLKYLDKEKYPPDETFLVHMAEHTVKSNQQPSIEILLNDKKIGNIDFEIAVSFTLKGVVLKIRDAKVKEIRTGTCEGSGTVKCENHLILEKKTGSISLPGSIDLGEGIPITAIPK